jgi:hypothetical protein
MFSLSVHTGYEALRASFWLLVRTVANNDDDYLSCFGRSTEFIHALLEPLFQMERTYGDTPATIEKNIVTNIQFRVASPGGGLPGGAPRRGNAELDIGDNVLLDGSRSVTTGSLHLKQSLQ